MIETELKEVRDPIESPVDTERYPLWDVTDERVRALVAGKRRELNEAGFFNLEGFLRPRALATCVAEVEPLMAHASFRHAQRHNVYFTPEDPPLPAGHGALARATTSNLAVTGDQLRGTVIRRVYEWDPLRAFLAAVFDKPRLYRMADPLACLNVMGYGADDGIGTSTGPSSPSRCCCRPRRRAACSSTGGTCARRRNRTTTAWHTSWPERTRRCARSRSGRAPSTSSPATARPIG
jgi:hypothetical protein